MLCFTQFNAGCHLEIPHGRVCHVNIISGGSNGVPGMRVPSPLVKIISFSCSFQQKFCRIIGFCTSIKSWDPPLWEIYDPPLIMLH